MSRTVGEPIDEKSFKFKFVQGARALGFRRKSGSITAKTLTLDEETIPVNIITETNVRGNWITIGLSSTTDLGEKTRKVLADKYPLTMEIHGITTEELERHIHRFTSAHAAKRNRQRLETEGKGELFRAVVCPVCGSSIDLSEMRITPMIYCRFCETVMTKNLEVMTDGDTYSICGECRLFDRIRSYRIFRLYFLVIAYGFGSERKHMCDACALKTSRRAFLLNLTMILAVPSAVYNFVKARHGRDPRLATLAKANAMAQKGRYEEADRIYDRLLMDNSYHPGILMNKAAGHFFGKDVAGAIQILNQSLGAAENYLPARNWLSALSQTAKVEPNAFERKQD